MEIRSCRHNRTRADIVQVNCPLLTLQLMLPCAVELRLVPLDVFEASVRSVVVMIVRDRAMYGKDQIPGSPIMGTGHVGMT